MPFMEEDPIHEYLSAEAALERGDTDSARRDLQRLLLEDARFAPGWDLLGRCYEAQGELEKAGDCYRKAMRLDRRNWRSRYNWGAALHRAGHVSEAGRWLREAARLAPAERCIHRLLGLCSFDLGDYEEALASFNRALAQPERDVTDAELYVQIGNAEGERGELAAADKAYERACLLAPDDPSVYYHWAVLAARQGDADGAARLAVRARALEPRSTRATLFLVRLAIGREDFKNAEGWIDRLQETPATARLAFALRAELAWRCGAADEARVLALQSLRMEGPPSDQAIDQALATLRELRNEPGSYAGFRLLLEVDCGDESYYRPFVVLARDEARAREYVREIQDALDTGPWRVAERERFSQAGEALAGVYAVLLTRVLFPRDHNPDDD